MPPDTFLGRIRFLIFQPVAAVAFIRTQRRYQLTQLRLAAVALVAFNFAFGWTLHKNEQAITSLPLIGGAVYSVLNAAWFVLDPLAVCMAIYIFTRK